MLNLQHILFARVEKSEDILKTIIYFEKISLMKKACKLLRDWMKQLNYSNEAQQWVFMFFVDMTKFDRSRVQKNFKILSSKCKIRIMCATEVYELGIDNPDILYVYQYMFFKTMTRLRQRVGRVLRSDQGQAYYVLLYSSWYEGPRSDRRIEDRKEKKKRSKKEDERNQRRDMSAELWSLSNSCTEGIGLFRG